MNRDQFTKEELLEARKRNNKSIKYKNDTIWESNNYGSFTIIGRLDSSHLYIQFIDTGAIYIKENSSISKGQVKDLYARSVCNKGFIGEGKYDSKSHKTIYSRWIGILNRIYGGNYPTYKDVTICEQWLNFQNFARDIEELMKEKGINTLEGYDIDKDIKSNGTKVYSKETVSLVTSLENVKEMHNRIHNTVYVAKNLITEEEIEFTNQSEFARENGLYVTNISSVLNGKAWSTGGFTFYVKGDEPRKKEHTIYVAENVKTKETIEFTNQSQFAREHNLNQGDISKVLNGRGKTTGDWTFYVKGDKAPDICVYIAENVKTGEKIKFTNQRQFAREHGLNPSNISKVLSGKRKTTGGWTFRKKIKKERRGN